MSKKKRKQSPSHKGSSLGFLLLAYGFSALCVAAGAAVLRFGTGEAGPDATVATGDVPTVGWMLIVLGVLGAGLCVVIQRTRQ